MKDRHTPNEGAIGTIKHGGKLYYARLLKAHTIGVYAKAFSVSLAPPLLPKLAHLPFAFEVPIHVGVIGKGKFEIVEKVPLLQSDIDAMKPQYWQDIADPSNCVLVFPDGSERKATPEECVGLEALGAADYVHILWQIDRDFNGVPNPTLDYTKVKLPKK